VAEAFVSERTSLMLNAEGKQRLKVEHIVIAPRIGIL
jgi:hypothetical protein